MVKTLKNLHQTIDFEPQFWGCAASLFVEDYRLTLTYFTSRSNIIPNDLSLMRKSGKGDFSETVEAKVIILTDMFNPVNKN